MIKLRQFYVFKLKTSRLQNDNYDLRLTLNDARSLGELIKIGDNQAFRTIRDVKGLSIDFEKVDSLFQEREAVKNLAHSEDNVRKIKELQDEIDSMLHMSDIINVKVDDKNVYKKIFKSGFKVNGVTYVRFASGAGQSRQSTASFINAEIYKEVIKRLNCGISIDKISIAKYNAYFGLYMSATYPVKTPRICIIPDCEDFVIKEKVDWIEDEVENEEYINSKGEVKVRKTIKRDVIEKDFDFVPNLWDGQGLISPTFAKVWQEDLKLDYLPSTFGVRSSFIKGLLVTFDFNKFAQDVVKKDKIIDIYGNSHDVDKIDVILTKSQTKMLKYYTSVEDFVMKQEENNLGWGITKINPKADKEMSLFNYQYVQTLNLDKYKIEKLVEPTINWIKKVCEGDDLYSLLFLLGVQNKNLEAEDILNSVDMNFIKAIMLNKNLLQDAYIKKKLYDSIEARIKDAKIGRFYVRGNYQCMISDPYGLAEFAFAEKTDNLKLKDLNSVKGLLNKNEYYSSFWNERNVKEVDACRSPMVDFHEHNKINFVNDDKKKKWYEYLNSGIIYNLWGTDTIRHSDSDWDYDIVFTTDNAIVLDSIIPNKNVITYEKSTAPELKLIGKNILKTDLNSFDSKIGQITNYSTTFISMLSNFKEDSEEYKSLIKRIKLLRRYIGDAIDSAKGIKTERFPSDWKTRVKLLSDDTDEIRVKKKKRNLLAANKKPYFMIYVYDKLKEDYNKYKREHERACKEIFGCKIFDLSKKKEKTEEEVKFLSDYYLKMPVLKNNSAMNTLCGIIEKTDVKYKRIKNDENIDLSYELLIDSNIPIDKELLDKLLELRNSFNYKKRNRTLVGKTEVIDKEDENFKLSSLYKEMSEKAYELCSNTKQLANHLVYIVYKLYPNDPKEFAWNLCPEGIIENIKTNSDGKIRIPVYDKNGTEYLNNYYSLKEMEVSE